MSEELKPCPFCGYKGIFDGGEGIWHVCQCNDCTAMGRADLGWSGAVENWNTRPIEDALQARLDELLSGLIDSEKELNVWKQASVTAELTCHELQTKLDVAVEAIKKVRVEVVQYYPPHEYTLEIIDESLAKLEA